MIATGNICPIAGTPLLNRLGLRDWRARVQLVFLVDLANGLGLGRVRWNRRRRAKRFAAVSTGQVGEEHLPAAVVPCDVMGHQQHHMLVAAGADDGDPQRCGAGRVGQSHGLDGPQHHAQLILQSLGDRVEASLIFLYDACGVLQEPTEMARDFWTGRMSGVSA